MGIKLSQIDDENLTDEQIDNIVYSDIEDDGLSSEYGFVFGNSMLINERVNTSVDAYKKDRVKKLIFMGGVNGVSNQDNSTISEAIKMKELALSLGVNENDILIDDISNNTFENIENAMKLLPKDIEHISIITSEFHLKRCYAILKKNYPNISITMIPSKDGLSDKDNWFLSNNSWNSGRSLATYEAHLLVKYAKENKIYDLEVKNFNKERRHSMQLLYATSNNSKIYNMRRRLKDIPIEIITPKELGIKVNVIEDGKTTVENAIKKARGYYEETKILLLQEILDYL